MLQTAFFGGGGCKWAITGVRPTVVEDRRGNQAWPYAGFIFFLKKLHKYDCTQCCLRVNIFNRVSAETQWQFSSDLGHLMESQRTAWRHNLSYCTSNTFSTALTLNPSQFAMVKSWGTTFFLITTFVHLKKKKKVGSYFAQFCILYDRWNNLSHDRSNISDQ